MFEQLISNQLRKHFQNDEVEGFYCGFAQEALTYQKECSETAQLVLEMVDYRAFKIAMIGRKRVYIEDRMPEHHYAPA